MEKQLKINFTYFWNDFNKQGNFITDALSKKHEVLISSDPDFLFCTHDYLGSKEYMRYDCIKIFIGLENERTDWSAFDYALDFDFINRRNHRRFPLWAYWNTDQLTLPKSPQEIAGEKKKFACMVVSNKNARERIRFFEQLNRYKLVDSGGRFMNNIGYPVTDKMEFIKDYKFVLSFENSSRPGYTTEKLIEPMLKNSIPIYWGNQLVNKDFNTKSFVNIHDFPDFDSAIKHIIELDNNRELYLNMLSEPWFVDNQVPSELTKESLSRFLEFVISDSRNRTPVSKTYKKYIHSLKRKMKSARWLIEKRLFPPTNR